MKKILLITSMVTLVSFSLDVNAGTEEKCVRKDFAPTTLSKTDQNSKLQTRFSYYKINAGDCILYNCNLYSRYIFQLNYTFDATTNKVTKIETKIPIVNHVNLLEIGRDATDSESFSLGDGNNIKITEYTPTIDSDGTASIEIEWSYFQSHGGSGDSDSDYGTSVIKIDKVGSWVDTAGGRCFVGANYSGLQKIGKKL